MILSNENNENGLPIQDLAMKLSDAVEFWKSWQLTPYFFLENRYHPLQISRIPMRSLSANYYLSRPALVPVRLG